MKTSGGVEIPVFAKVNGRPVKLYKGTDGGLAYAHEHWHWIVKGQAESGKFIAHADHPYLKDLNLKEIIPITRDEYISLLAEEIFDKDKIEAKEQFKKNPEIIGYG